MYEVEQVRTELDALRPELMPELMDAYRKRTKGEDSEQKRTGWIECGLAGLFLYDALKKAGFSEPDIVRHGRDFARTLGHTDAKRITEPGSTYPDAVTMAVNMANMLIAQKTAESN